MGDIVTTYAVYGSTTHAARVVASTDSLARAELSTTAPLCESYRTKDGNQLAKHLRYGLPLVRAAYETDENGKITLRSWGDVATDQRCQHCEAVLTYGGDGQPRVLVGTTVADAKAELTVLGKGITPRQQSAIKALISNDYAQVQAKLALEHEQHVQAGLKKIEDQFAAKQSKVDAARAKFDAMVKLMGSQIDSFVKDQGKAGVDVTLMSYSQPRADLRIAGRSQALKEFKDKADAALRQATKLLATRRLMAERQVLLAVLDKDLLSVVEDMVPSASDVFADAIRELQLA